MTWAVDVSEPVQAFLDELDADDLRAVAASIRLLEALGPNLSRPHADVLKTSRHKNMKELRTGRGDSQFRILFAFDSRRRAILLIGGEKVGYPGGTEAFYKQSIKTADELFDAHQQRVNHEIKVAAKELAAKSAVKRKHMKKKGKG